MRLLKTLTLIHIVFSFGLSGCKALETSKNFLVEDTLFPKMVDIPSGEFLMGCVSGKHCRENEFPIHRVTVDSFQMSATEVTFGLWDLCVNDGACSHSPDHKWVPDKNTGLRKNLPVMLVTFFDVTEEFIPWLNNKTGMNYRLPTESEWEYAARAGSTTPFHTGNCLSPGDSNYNTSILFDECPEHPYRGKAMPVGSFSPNEFGLYDMHGNVWEWTQDCWSNSDQAIPAIGTYKGASLDAKANLNGDCTLRVIRGGPGIQTLTIHAQPIVTGITLVTGITAKGSDWPCPTNVRYTIVFQFF